MHVSGRRRCATLKFGRVPNNPIGCFIHVNDRVTKLGACVPQLQHRFVEIRLGNGDWKTWGHGARKLICDTNASHPADLKTAKQIRKLGNVNN